MATNVTFMSQNPESWRDAIGLEYEPDIINWLLQNPGKYLIINDLQKKHHDIYLRNTDNGALRPDIEDDDLVGAYQLDIINNFNIVNTKGILKGNTTGRYNISSTASSGDNSKQNWRADKKYGAETDDRRVLGRKGDYNLGDLEELAERLEPAGLELYLDPETNYYMVRPIDETLRGDTIDETTGKVIKRPLVQASPLKKNPKDWLGLFSKAKSNYPGWSDWIPLSAKKLIDDLAAIRTGLLERKKRFPLFEAPQEYAKVTDAYALRQLLEKQKLEVLARAGYNPASDLTLNLNARIKGELVALEIADKLIALKSKEFSDTTKLVQDVANKNNMYRTNVANLNILSNVAAYNNILSSNIKLVERLASNLGTYIGDMYVNFGEYLKTKRLNNNSSKRQAALYKFNKIRTKAYKPYYTLLDSPQTWSRLGEFREALNAEGITSLTDDQKRIWNEAAVSGNYNNPEFVNLLITQLKSGTSAAAQKYRALYTQELNELLKRAEYISEQAEGELYNTLSSIDTYATNQWGWNPLNKVKKSVLSEKQGGKVEDMFSKLERLRLREQLSIRETTLKRNKTISDNLNKQLDRISKEELALLRAIFK